MARTKIAWTLQSWVTDDGRWAETMGVDAAEKQAQTELRALLALERAARRFMSGEGNNDRYGIPRALARLDRLSGRKP